MYRMTPTVFSMQVLPFANDKIGPGAPPLRTDKGWLTLFHAVERDDSRGKNGWESKWTKRYYAGAILLDLNDPTKILGITKRPLLSPTTDYEKSEGYRTHVIFPGGIVPCREDSKNTVIYYGASDTVECAAAVNIDELILQMKKGMA